MRNVGNIAKSTSFPLENEQNRISTPSIVSGKLNLTKCKSNYLLCEKPLLLNPEIDDFKPEQHLLISPNGTIKGITKHGEITIEKCKLNRDGLTNARKKIVDEHLLSMMYDFKMFKDRIIEKKQLQYSLYKEIKKISDRINENKPYTLLARNMLKYFDRFSFLDIKE